jgi:hypothetical protein
MRILSVSRERPDLLHDFAPADARARYHVAVAPYELGGRVDHQVGAVLEGMLENRTEESVVDHHHRPLVTLCQRGRELYRALDVNQTIGGVGRRLDQ